MTTAASTTTKSRVLIDCSSSCPRPGSAKICSMMTVPPISVPRFSPTTVIRPNELLRDVGRAERAVAERVPDQHLPRTQALGLRRRDVVLALHLVDQVAAQEAAVE